MMFGNIQHKRGIRCITVCVCQPYDIAVCIFRTCQFLTIAMQAESIMNALLQNTSRLVFPFYDQYICTVSGCTEGSRKTCRSGTDDKDIIFLFHFNISSAAFSASAASANAAVRSAAPQTNP